jgi:GH25 family lysozyme M1 (1,4-beta-N-acetylmuramidase)
MKLKWFSSFAITAALLTFETALGPSRAMAQRPLGTDVSGYQPSINWTTVKNAGVTFACAKATERTTYTNPYFTTQEAGATSVGIYIGAYHFARPSLHPNITGANSADSEAAYFWSVAGNYIKYGGAYCVPMLDWEDTDMTNQLSASTLSAWVIQWCNTVSNYARFTNGVIGMKPVIYTGAWYSKPSSTYSGLTTAVTNLPAWISYYPAGNSTDGFGTPFPLTDPMPSATRCYPWSACNIWQYGDTNWSGGDCDVFNGNLSQFIQMFVIGGTNAPFFTSNPTNLTLPVGANATFSVTASGLAPLSYQWQFNGTNIPGATSTNYTVSNIQITNAGGYTVVVSNSYAKVPSTTAFLAVLSQLSNTIGCILSPSNMVNWWPAEGNGLDIFGANNASLNGGVSYGAGKQMRAFHFDGLTSYLTTSAASIAAPWTACMWVNRQNAPGTAAAIMGDGSYEIKLEQYNATHQVGLTRFGAWDANFGVTVPQNTWTHVAFVGTASGTSLYINGALSGSLTNTLPCPRGYIGAGWVTSSAKFVDWMLGSLDEIMVFNRALSASEISAISAAGSAGLVRAPEFTACLPLGNGQTQLSLRGKTGKNVTVYSSPDLGSWTSLGSVANPVGSTVFMDNSATNPQSFYRASQP